MTETGYVHAARVSAHTAVAARLSSMRDHRLQATVAAAPPLGKGTGGRPAETEVDGARVFVKRVPLTDLELRPENIRQCLRAGFLATPFPHTTDRPGPGRGGDADYSVAGTLVLSETGCGTFSHLVITGTNTGQVWLDNRSWGGLTPGPNFHDWYTAWLASQ